MRRRALIVFSSALLCGGAVVAESLPIAWLSPAGGREWVAGEAITLEWRQTGAWPRELEIEEWEAFLSLDGGRSFPVRLTPHLGAELRAVRVTVPSLPAGHARLLLRFGDERRETEWAVPGEFTIAAGEPAPAASPAPLSDLDAVRGRGEAARPGEPGVLLWAEGRRDGGDWRAASAVPVPGVRPAVERQRAACEGAQASESPNPELDCRLPGSGPPATARRATGRASPRTRRGIAILRLTERQNE